MVNLTDKMRIIQMHLSGRSNREIAGDLGLNRKIVDKYVARYQAAQETITADGMSPLFARYLRATRKGSRGTDTRTPLSPRRDLVVLGEQFDGLQLLFPRVHLLPPNRDGLGQVFVSIPMALVPTS